MIRLIGEITVNRWQCDCGYIMVGQKRPRQCRKCNKSASGRPVGRPKLLKSGDMERSEPKMEEVRA